MTTGGFTIETEFSYGLLAAPQSILEPLSLASVRKSMERGGKGQLWFSRDSPEHFESTETPDLRDDVRIDLVPTGMAIALATGHAAEPEEADEDEDWEDEFRSLLAPLLRSYQCEEPRFERDIVLDERMVALIPLPRRIKTVEQALHIGEHAAALLRQAALGPLTRQRVVELVRAGFARAVVELAEGPWLEGKGKPYRLGEEAQKWELAKDVASFANAEGGGVIVIGARTERKERGDVITIVKDIPLDMIDAERYRRVIRTWVRPFVEGLEVRGIDHGDGRGVAFIHVPPQDDDLKPFVVKGILRRGRVETSYVSVPIRDGEGTAIAHVSEIQELLRAGRSAMRRGELPDPL